MVTYKIIQQHLNVYGSANIIIAGQTCSGKTTLANKIKEHFSNKCSTCIVSQDDYFRNLEDIPRAIGGYLTDSIDAFYVTEFRKDVQALLRDSFAIMPQYDIATNTRVSKNKIVRAGKINIFEGLHTIELLSDMENSIKIYVDTDIDICLDRRIARDTSKYGIPEYIIRPYWQNCILPMCRKFIFPQKDLADITINCKGGVACAS